MALLVGPEGKVVSLDIYPELLEIAKGTLSTKKSFRAIANTLLIYSLVGTVLIFAVNIRKNHGDLLDNEVIEMREADGWHGVFYFFIWTLPCFLPSSNFWQASDRAPFDAIHVGAGAESMPKDLVEQLKPGGSKSSYYCKTKKLRNGDSCGTRVSVPVS